jgi:hypothetical protein
MKFARTELLNFAISHMRPGKGNITIEVRDTRDRKVGSVAIDSPSVGTRGRTRIKPVVVNWDELKG